MSNIYIISDLHMGDGSARDNFAVDDKDEQLKLFAQKVKAEGAELFILGDLFEFWQASLGRVLVERKALLDCLAEAGATYIVGNHDIDLEALIGTDFLAHPFFKKMVNPFGRTIGGKKFYFMHGHEVDEYNKGDKPGKGRALTILAGLAEDSIGSPFFDTERKQSVEVGLTRLGEAVLWLWEHFVCYLSKVRKKTDMTTQRPTPRQKPSLHDEHLVAMRKYKNAGAYDAVVCGHTHELGTFEDWYFNSGGWAESSNDVLKIDDSGEITFHEFSGGELAIRGEVPALKI